MGCPSFLWRRRTREDRRRSESITTRPRIGTKTVCVRILMRDSLVNFSMDNIVSLFCLNHRLSQFVFINPTKITTPFLTSYSPIPFLSSLHFIFIQSLDHLLIKPPNIETSLHNSYFHTHISPLSFPQNKTTSNSTHT